MRLRQWFTGLLTAMTVGATAQAEDIDIFFSGAGSGVSPDAFVMLSLDWRPNFFSTVCNGACPEFHDILGEHLECEDGTCQEIKRFELFRAALKLVLAEIAEAGLSGMKFGLMLNHEHSNNCEGPNPSRDCSNGGYILLGFQDLAVETERDLFFDKLDALPNPHGNASHKYQGAELYFEFFRYLTGQGIYNGHNGWTDFGTNNNYNIDDPLDAVGNPPGIMGWDAAVENGTDYTSPLVGANECSRVYAINLLHQVSQQEADSDDAIEAVKAQGGMGIANNQVEFDSVIGYMQDEDLADGSFNAAVDVGGKTNVTSYFIVDPSKVNTTTNGYAQAGGTGSAIAFSDDPEELVLALRKILQEIIGISTTFVTTSVAANTLNRAQTLEALYVGLFEPNEDLGPFWEGNVKRLMIRIMDVPVVDEYGDPVLDAGGNPVTEEDIMLVDAPNATTGNPPTAINPADGRISKSALTFWTDADSLTAAPAEGDPNYTDDTDGREVARGGSGQRIPGFMAGGDPKFDNDNDNGRKVFTEPVTFTAGTAESMIALDADTGTAIDLLQNSDELYETVMNCTSCSYSGETDGAKKTEAENKTINMIKFSRGYDVPFDTGNYTDPDGRYWWVADPLHSRPLILNFGARGSFDQGTPDVRILVAGNGGVFHMIKDTDPNGSHSGVETWAFLPRQFVPLQKRFMEGSLGSVHTPGVPATITPRVPSHPYSLDASASALVIDNNFDGTVDATDDDKVYVFLCMRRGGKRCYALDITDPDQPKFLWTLAKGDTGFEELAQTWSLLRPDLVSFKNASNQLVTVPALFISGGYNGDDGSDGWGDLGKDSRVLNANSNSEILGTDDFEGNAIFVVDARDGSLIWKAAGPSDGSDTANGWDATTLAYEVNTLKDSVPTSPTLLDSDGDRAVDRFYVPDSGGNLWRGDMVPGPRSAWTLTKVLSLGRHYSADNANDRRFFARADLARAKEPDDSQAQSGLPFDTVVLMSGDRAHPLGTDVENWAYMFKDKNIISGDPPSTVVTHADLQDLTNNCLQDGNNSDCTDLDNGSLPKLNQGWKMRLNHCEDLSESNTCGEKGLSRPLIVNRTVFFNSYLPPNTSGSGGDICKPRVGSGLFYAVSLFDASAVLDFDLSNNAGGVVLDRFDELSSPGIPPASVALSPDLLLRPDLRPQPIPAPPNSPTFWYERSLK